MMKRPDIARKLFHQYASKMMLEPISRKIYRSNLTHNGKLTKVILQYRFFTHSVRGFSSSDKLPESKATKPDPNMNPDVKIVQSKTVPEESVTSAPNAELQTEKVTAKAVIQETHGDGEEAVNRSVMEKSELMVIDPITSKSEEKTEKKTTAKSIIKEAVEKVTKKKLRVDLNSSSMERNFVTPLKAMSDFLLKASDLETVRGTKRRSPYESEPPITVYWRTDVEAKAMEVWGSKENLTKELLKREFERRFHQQKSVLYIKKLIQRVLQMVKKPKEQSTRQNCADSFTTKRKLRDYRREKDHQREVKMIETIGLFGSSGRVVLTAIAVNGCNLLFKMFAWSFTGSHSMFSECIHSLADTINQIILAFGIHKSIQRADSDHPYGYTNMRYVASLISGVGIFCVGTGLSLYHGVTGLLHPTEIENYFWGLCVLGGALVSEGATCIVAFNAIKKGAKKADMSVYEYVLRGNDPSVNVVLLEDFAAVVGVATAATCMGLSYYYKSHIPDAIGSLIVGGILGCVASFIIYTNVAALVGRSIPYEYLEKINLELESDVMIRAIYDVKGIDMGNSLIRYKAEVDFDGRELTRSYLDRQDLNVLLEEVKKLKDIDEVEAFMVKHSENIVDMMGGEIDRIEMKLRKKFPDLRHCDLEIL